MKKRTMLLGSTMLISLMYAGGFILLFSQDAETSSKSVLLVSEEISKDELVWLQAGVFKEESSYLGLKEKIQGKGFEVLCVDLNDLTYVLVEPQTDEKRVDDMMEELVSEGIEVIKKKAVMNETQSQLFDEKKLYELMEGLISK